MEEIIKRFLFEHVRAGTDVLGNCVFLGVGVGSYKLMFDDLDLL